MKLPLYDAWKTAYRNYDPNAENAAALHKELIAAEDRYTSFAKLVSLKPCAR